jgi:hypothetical protein
MIEKTGFEIEGFIKIIDEDSGEVVLDKKNKIHYENISEAIANTLSGKGKGQLFKMAFGNGGSSIDASGTITYLPPNVIGQNAALYAKTYDKIINDFSSLNLDSSQNRMTVTHVPGKVYTDIVIECTLDYGEPTDQMAFDNAINLNTTYTFDEMGLIANFGQDSSGADITRLISHAVFHPVQKALNKRFKIYYTIRIQSLTAMVTI